MWDTLYKILYMNLIAITLKHAACTAWGLFYTLLYKLNKTYTGSKRRFYVERTFTIYLPLKKLFCFIPCTDHKHTRYTKASP